MKVDLLAPHTHEGAERKVGDVIELPDDSAAWLINLGVAKPHGPAAKKSRPSEE